MSQLTWRTLRRALLDYALLTIGAALLAFIVLGEVPSALKIAAAALILGGIYLALDRRPAGKTGR